MKDLIKNGILTPSGLFVEMHHSLAVKVFAKEGNVRDHKISYDDANVLADSIIAEGGITEPVRIGTIEVKDLDEFSKKTPAEQAKIIQAVAGYRRANVLDEIIRGKQDARHEGVAASMPEFIPAFLEVYENQDELEKAKLDHGTQKGLNSYELGLCVEKLMGLINSPTEKEAIFELRNDLARNAAQTKVDKLQKKIKEEVLDKTWYNPQARLDAEKTILMKFWRGTFQRLLRIFVPKNGNPFLKENYHAEIIGDDFVKFTSEELVELSTLEPSAFKVKVEEIIKKNNGSPVKERMMTQKVLEEKLDLYKNNICVHTIIGTILKVDASIELWPEITDLLKDVSSLYLHDKNACKALIAKATSKI